MRRSLAVLLLLAPLAVALVLNAVGRSGAPVDIVIAPGGGTFAVDGSAPRLLPGTVLVDDFTTTDLVVANRDSVDRVVGVIRVPARSRIEVPVEQCSPTTVGSRAVVVVR